MKTNLFLKLLLVNLTVISISGCDMMSSIEDHFDKDKKETKATKETPQASTKPPLPQTTQSTPAKPMSGNELARV